MKEKHYALCGLKHKICATYEKAIPEEHHELHSHESHEPEIELLDI